MEYDSIEVPAARVDRTSGIFNPGDASDRFLEYNLDEVLTHANRIIANFNFTATADAGSTGVPLIWDAKCPRRLAAGPWQYHNLIGYTSKGSGTSIVDVRLNCLPEVTLHELLAG